MGLVMGIEQALERMARQVRSGWHSLEAIRRWNRDLAGLRLGVEIYLADQPFHGTWVVGYAELPGAGWCLAVRESATAVPLAEAPRPVQVAALVLLPKLFEELGRQVNIAVRGIEWARLIPESLPRLAGEAQRRATGSGPAPRSAKPAPRTRRAGSESGHTS